MKLHWRYERLPGLGVLALAGRLDTNTAMRGAEPEPLRGPCARIGGRWYPVMQIGAQVTGQDRRDFTAAEVIRASKTDQDAAGEYVPVKTGRHPDTDPVALLRAWTGAPADLGAASGPLLRAVTRHDALFPHGFMTGEAINERIRVIGRRAGLRDARCLTAHGLRAGPASTAAKRGPLSAIAQQGRWSPNSPVVFGYIREADRWNQYPDIGL
jgi:integrase